MKKISAILIAAVIGYASVALAVFAIALTLITDSQRDNFFWYRLAWSEFLILIIFIPTFAFYKYTSKSSHHSNQVIAILPSAKIVLICYSTLSFFIMYLNSLENGSKLSNPVYLSIQISMTAIVGVIFSTMIILGKSSTTELENVFQKNKSPRDLCDSIYSAEKHLSMLASSNDDSATKSLKKLREYINYSLPHAGQYGDSDEYNIFADRINKLSEELKKQSKDSGDGTEIINKQVENLYIDAKRIARRQITA